ncbi:MAG: nickel pincer cofactor biosynthesis protein LarC [Oscillospiraceae bacterium]|nr:nickel pincer cofactor biosynthesis protein LarC [Oscillospiraceae bacterium]
MRTLYLELNMGAAGDMLAAALAGLLDDTESFVKELRGMNIPGAVIALEEKKSLGISGKAFSVKINGHSEEDGHHLGHSMHDIRHIVEKLNTSEDIKRDILAVYNIIAGAESKMHGVDVREVHFHEVGMLDAVADIAAVCLAMKKLNPERVVATPVHVGSGTVKCAHGTLPVPAPATAEILRGIPIYGGKVRGELCTPTGAALLKYFVSSFGNMPVICAEKIGYGMGKREFETVNCVRAMLCEENSGDEVSELSANIDDMTGEDIAYAAETLLSCGALDVWTESIGMKKSRPGTKLCVLCETARAEEFAKLLLMHTTTLGVRENICTRYVLSRKNVTEKTPIGTVRKKVSEGYGIKREKYEHDDLVRLARETGKSLLEIKKFLSGR